MWCGLWNGREDGDGGWGWSGWSCDRGGGDG